MNGYANNAGAAGSSASAYPYRAPAPKAHHKKKHRRHVKHAKSGGAGRIRSDINVTPLVDVVLVLLIIFMVVTPMLHRGVDLELPKTKNHSTRQDTGEQLVVSVRADGVFIEADKVELDKLSGLLEAALKNGPRPVNVHGDLNLKFGEMRKVLEQVHASGAQQVNMETKEQKE